VALRKSGIPKCFGPLAVDIERGQVPTLGLRLILTVLFASRGLVGPNVPDLTPIVEPSERCPSTLGVGWRALEFWKCLGYRHSGSVPRALR